MGGRCGLVVNKAEDRPPARVPRETQRRLRAAIKNRELGRPGKDGESLDQLKGMAAFIMMTDLARGKAFMERLDRLVASAASAPKPQEKE